MAVKPALPEEYEAGQRFLQAEVRVPKAEARNVAIAAEIDADSYFTFKGTTYKTPPISYKIGVQLQEIHMEITRLSRVEEETNNLDTLNDDDRLIHLNQMLACYQRAVGLFQVCCFPVAFWKIYRHKRRNPFADCTAKEIAELFGFFSLCRMKSRVNMLGGLATTPSLSIISTQRTN